MRQLTMQKLLVKNFAALRRTAHPHHVCNPLRYRATHVQWRRQQVLWKISTLSLIMFPS
jgi:hypothetical protein